MLRRGGKNTQQKYTKKKKTLNNPDNHEGVITHLEPDIWEWEVKCALVSITTNKASGGNGIPAEPCQILKDDSMKRYVFQYDLTLNMPANLENLAVATKQEQVSFH